MAQVEAVHVDGDPEKPNHIILWLDVGIGESDRYTHLKKAFGSNTDPRSDTWTMLQDKDYDILSVDDNPQLITFGGDLFLLQCFTEVEQCLAAVERYQDKRIFFITSGRLGRSFVPQIVDRYPRTLFDPITHEAYTSIYVFCHSIEYQLDWALEYADHLLAFNFDADLLTRLVRDVSEYFVECGRRLQRDNHLKDALKHFHWARRLWDRHDKIEQNATASAPKPARENGKTRKIELLITEIEKMLPGNSSDEDDDDDVSGTAPD